MKTLLIFLCVVAALVAAVAVDRRVVAFDRWNPNGLPDSFNDKGQCHI